MSGAVGSRRPNVVPLRRAFVRDLPPGCFPDRHMLSELHTLSVAHPCQSWQVASEDGEDERSDVFAMTKREGTCIYRIVPSPDSNLRVWLSLRQQS